MIRRCLLLTKLGGLSLQDVYSLQAEELDEWVQEVLRLHQEING